MLEAISAQRLIGQVIAYPEYATREGRRASEIEYKFLMGLKSREAAHNHLERVDTLEGFIVAARKTLPADVVESEWVALKGSLRQRITTMYRAALALAEREPRDPMVIYNHACALALRQLDHRQVGRELLRCLSVVASLEQRNCRDAFLKCIRVDHDLASFRRSPSFRAFAIAVVEIFLPGDPRPECYLNGDWP
jgi:hypothetical protein